MRRPLLPSVLTGICALLIHPSAGVPISRAISFELQRGNAFAFLTLGGIAWVISAMAARFWRDRYVLSAATCALCLGLLAVIPCTAPYSAVHNFAYVGLIALAMALFLLWALDTFELLKVVPPLLPITLGLAFYGALGVGGFQLVVIGSLLVALNLTFRHIETRDLR